MASFNDVVNDIISFTRKIVVTFYESLAKPVTFRKEIESGVADRYITPSLYFFIALFIHLSFVLSIILDDPYVWTNTDSFLGSIYYYLLQTSLINRILYTLPSFCLLYSIYWCINRLLWKKTVFPFYQKMLRYWIATSLIIINLTALILPFITHELMEAIFTSYYFDSSTLPIKIINTTMDVAQILSFLVPFFSIAGAKKIFNLKRIAFCLLIGSSFQASKILITYEINIVNRFEPLQRVEILNNELSKKDFKVDLSPINDSVVKIGFSFIVRNNSKTNIFFSRDSSVDIYTDNPEQQAFSIIKGDTTRDTLTDLTLKISDSSNKFNDHFDLIKGEGMTTIKAEILLTKNIVDTFRLLFDYDVKYKLLYTYIVGDVKYHCDKEMRLKYKEDSVFKVKAVNAPLFEPEPKSTIMPSDTNKRYSGIKK